jgi:hypothetical protein
MQISHARLGQPGVIKAGFIAPARPDEVVVADVLSVPLNQTNKYIELLLLDYAALAVFQKSEVRSVLGVQLKRTEPIFQAELFMIVRFHTANAVQ